MESYILARKWRPQRFEEVVGHTIVLQTLAYGLQKNRLPPAVLFSGNRGVGKTTLSRLLAKGLNCVQGPTTSPCCVCDLCLSIQAGTCVDVLEIDAASHTKVEDMRELIENILYAPLRCRTRVYLIDEVHMLSRHSFNALLKSLEEPPPHVQFIFATTDPEKLPDTIRSRLLHLKLQDLSPLEISEQLKILLEKEKIPFEMSAVQRLAQAAEGSLRDALMLTDQAIARGDRAITQADVDDMVGVMPHSLPEAILQALLAKKTAEALAQLQPLAARNLLYEQLLMALATTLHRWGVDKMVNTTPSPMLANVSAVQLLQAYRMVLQGLQDLLHAPSYLMATEMTLLRLQQVLAPSEAQVAEVLASVEAVPPPPTVQGAEQAGWQALVQGRAALHASPPSVQAPSTPTQTTRWRTVYDTLEGLQTAAQIRQFFEAHDPLTGVLLGLPLPPRAQQLVLHAQFIEEAPATLKIIAPAHLKHLQTPAMQQGLEAALKKQLQRPWKIMFSSETTLSGKTAHQCITESESAERATRMAEMQRSPLVSGLQALGAEAVSLSKIDDPEDV